MDSLGLLGKDLHRPVKCEQCQGKMEYKGIGEYRCESCDWLAYDDYGKVRNYLEHHRGATQSEVAKATGVSTSTIRSLLRDDKIEVTENSAVFLYCESCGKSIRSGRLCNLCAKVAENASRRQTSNNIAGFGKGNMDTSGAKRFQR